MILKMAPPCIASHPLRLRCESAKAKVLRTARVASRRDTTAAWYFELRPEALPIFVRDNEGGDGEQNPRTLLPQRRLNDLYSVWHEVAAQQNDR